MSETGDFLAATMPQLTDAEIAMHNGDAAPRIAMWSPNEPVTLFGAAVTAIRAELPGPGVDRWLSPELAAAERLVRSGALIEAAEAAIGALA